jgi:hypothetical protein
MKNSVEDYLYPLGWALLAALAVWQWMYRTGDGLPGALLPGCFLYRLTGWYCPACGGTRAVLQLLAGHPLQSFICHPVVPYLAFVGGWFMISQTVERLSRGRFPVGLRYRDRYMWIAAGLFALQFILRNLFRQVWGIGIPGI